AQAGVDFIQLREKDLSARALYELACLARATLTRYPKTTLLVNGRLDVAIAARAHGVHLPADDVEIKVAREFFRKAGVRTPLIAVSCHTLAEIRVAAAENASFAVFGPVFEKNCRQESSAGKGLSSLREACALAARGKHALPVLALGGVSPQNARACMQAGAAGVAGIRMFQEHAIALLRSRLSRIHSIC
ncbi:MAG: thiamine phosphate synthase, partial [Candidatus Acidiferrum sp.]